MARPHGCGCWGWITTHAGAADGACLPLACCLGAVSAAPARPPSQDATDKRADMSRQPHVCACERLSVAAALSVVLHRST
jgi:hypothetical protein